MSVEKAQWGKEMDDEDSNSALKDEQIMTYKIHLLDSTDAWDTLLVKNIKLRYNQLTTNFGSCLSSKSFIYLVVHHFRM